MVSSHSGLTAKRQFALDTCIATAGDQVEALVQKSLVLWFSDHGSRMLVTLEMPGAFDACHVHMVIRGDWCCYLEISVGSRWRAAFVAMASHSPFRPLL